jgi:TonB-dependent SusC/RagA subfamily outer membrane receptor
MSKHFYQTKKLPPSWSAVQKKHSLLNPAAVVLTLLCVFFVSMNSVAQSPTVTGTVTTTSNEALPGVSVYVKGTTNGTTTDSNGKFSIQADSKSILVFSFIGFATTEILVGNQNDITLQLEEDIFQLSEVVVTTSFGIKQERKALGYSVQEVGNRLLLETNQPNALNAMRGRVSGVSIVSSSGAPGAGTSINIRGINSLNPTANNQPLFVIDGIPVSNDTDLTGGREGDTFTNTNRFADINTDDIESISVLKGPAASALYGLRAANGAIIITTKAGKSGKTTFN